MSRFRGFDFPIEEEPPSTADDDGLDIDLRLSLDDVGAAEAERLRDSVHGNPTRKELLQLASRMYDARRLRDRLLNGQQDLFGEPAWDMLLALYCLPARGEILGISSLTHAAHVPQTTGHRWQRILRKEGLIEAGPHQIDLRRRIVRLTPRGRLLLERYLTRLFLADKPLAPEPDTASD